MYEALAARSAQALQDRASCCTSMGVLTSHVQQGLSCNSDSAAAGEQSMPVDMPKPEFSFANRWLNEPGRDGIGLQACRLVVDSEDVLMGSNPAVFEANTPWWREPG